MANVPMYYDKQETAKLDHLDEEMHDIEGDLADEFILGIVLVVVIVITVIVSVLWMRRSIQLQLQPGPGKYRISPETAKILGLTGRISSVTPKTQAQHVEVLRSADTGAVIVRKTDTTATPLPSSTSITADGTQTSQFDIVIPLSPLQDGNGMIVALMMNLHYTDNEGKVQTCQAIADSGSGSVVVPQVPGQEAGNARRWHITYVSQSASGFVADLILSYAGSTPISALANVSSAIVPAGESLPYFVHGLAPCNGDLVSIIDQLSIRTVSFVMDMNNPRVVLGNYINNYFNTSAYKPVGTWGLMQASHYVCIPQQITFICDDGYQRSWNTVYNPDGSPPYTTYQDPITKSTQMISTAVQAILDTGTSMALLPVPMSMGSGGSSSSSPMPNVKSVVITSVSQPQTASLLSITGTGGSNPPTNTISFDISENSVPMPDLMQYGADAVLGLIIGINALKNHHMQLNIGSDGFPESADFYQSS